MKSQIRPAVVCFILLSILTGVVYPAGVTLIAKTVFARQAEGSLVMRDDRAIGSALIAQPFTDARYFWPRPSACNYDGAAGSGSNQGPTNPARITAVNERTAAQQAAAQSTMPVPVDLVMASGSGLDPHITPEAARYQVHRIAMARNMPDAAVQTIVDRMTQPRTFGVLGDPRVNVLKLNMVLDHPELLEHQRTTDPTTIQTYRWRGFLPD